MIVLLTLLTCLAAAALLGLVVWDVWRIVRQLDAIGGTPTSFLAKIRFGLRAIETETSHLAPQVTALNAGLTQLAEGLGAVEKDLSAVRAHLTGGGA